MAAGVHRCKAVFEGEASGGGVISLSLSIKDDCDMSGAAAFRGACVDVVPVEGRSSILGMVFVRTTDGSLVLDELWGDYLLNNDPESFVSGPSHSYVYTNTQNVPNCPQSETGTVNLRSGPH